MGERIGAGVSAWEVSGINGGKIGIWRNWRVEKKDWGDISGTRSDRQMRVDLGVICNWWLEKRKGLLCE
jgi:hypothetical protein